MYSMSAWLVFLISQKLHLAAWPVMSYLKSMCDLINHFGTCDVGTDILEDTYTHRE